MRPVLIAVIMLMIGCASMPEEDRLFYMMHAVDGAQTYQISKSPCHSEGGLGTSSIIGEHPRAVDVAAWGIVTAVTYHYISDKLPDWTKHINIVYRVHTVNRNYDHGLTVGSYSCETRRRSAQ